MRNFIADVLQLASWAIYPNSLHEGRRLPTLSTVIALYELMLLITHNVVLFNGLFIDSLYCMFPYFIQ